MVNLEKYISRWEAQSSIGCTNSEIQILLDEGVLEYVVDSKGRILVRRDSVKAYMDSSFKGLPPVLLHRIILLEKKVAYLEQRLQGIERSFQQAPRVETLPKQKKRDKDNGAGKKENTLSKFPLLSESKLSVRAKNVLKNSKIRTVEKLAALTPQDLRMLRGCGKQTQKELVEFLRGYRLSPPRTPSKAGAHIGKKY